MFRTMREAELVIGADRLRNGLQFWSFIELETIWPWFYVETVESCADFDHVGAILAANIQLLKDIVVVENSSAKIKEVQIFSPGYMNGTKSWRMEVLHSVKELTNKDGSLVGYEYEVDGGVIYSTAADSYEDCFRTTFYEAAIY